MGYSSPATQSSGQIPPVSWANSVKTALDYLANPPACRANRTTTQSLVTATATSILFDAEVFDTDTMHDTVSNTSRLTVKTAGLYIVTAGLGFAANATGVRVAWVNVNGSDATRIIQGGMTAVSASDVTDIPLATIYKFAVNDYMELRGYQTSGGNLNTATLQLPHLEATWIGLG